MTVTPTAPTPAPTIAYDRSGNPIDLPRYSALHRDLDYRVLHRGQAAGLSVVTVWLGIDQGPLGDETRPLIYGTAILDPRTGSLWENHETFAATEDEAHANHRHALDTAATRTIF